MRKLPLTIAAYRKAILTAVNSSPPIRKRLDAFRTARRLYFSWGNLTTEQKRERPLEVEGLRAAYHARAAELAAALDAAMESAS